MKEIKAIAMPGTHQSFLKHFKSCSISSDKRILDLGAGHGAFTQKLHEMGYNVSACDLFPELFEFNEVECKKVDITQTFPYDDNSFDIVIAVEVSEHIVDHEMFFSELSRILVPGGTLYISTPNILSLKSRMQYLTRGFFYSFAPLEMSNNSGLQHVASLTLDQYNYVAIKNGFKSAEYAIDKRQNTSKVLLVLVYPIFWFNSKIRKIKSIHNEIELLLGRLLFLTFNNNKK
ncbi:MAG: class I SAM-dependent methyltransferase [bacterium]